MATSTLIQKLFGADEIASSDDLGQSSTAVSNRQQTETFHCSEAITAGAAVALDVSQANNGLRSLVVAEADATDYVIVGVYTGGDNADDAEADTDIEVVIRGIVEEALVDGSGSAITAGDALFVGVDGKLINQEEVLRTIFVHFLNTEYIKLAFDSAAQFEMDDFEHVSGYASRSANIYTRMQIYFTHLASQGLHVNP